MKALQPIVRRVVPGSLSITPDAFAKIVGLAAEKAAGLNFTPVCVGCGHENPSGLHIAGCAEAQRKLSEPPRFATVKIKPWDDWNRRFRFGRLSIYIEPRDIWVGCYIAPDAVYVCPLPLLVFRWTRVLPPEVTA